MLSDPDEALMLRYCEGDLPAFKELYRRHSDGLYRFIAWRTPRKDWVDEIFQESWVALHRARSTYTPQSAFRTFLYQIARNRLVDLLRQHQLVLASDLGHDEDGQGMFEHLADQSQEADSPEEILERKQEAAELHVAIHSLPREQKEALIMQQFNDMSLEEIAQLYQVPMETVRSRLRYAMRKLRERLAEPARKHEERV